MPDPVDNCPLDPNPDQSNLDAQDGGDVCDVCPQDATDTCDPNRSGGGSISAAGGTVSTPDGSVTIEIPAGAVDDDTSFSITDSGNGIGFEISTSVGNGKALFAVTLAPEGLTFNVPITICFSWLDEAPEDGTIDGTFINENDVLITKNDEGLTGQCSQEPGPIATTGAECDPVANTFCAQVSTLSEFTIFEPNAADSDGDGVFDDVDNCITAPNPDQEDTDGDLCGNHCDADYNQDSLVSILDFGDFRTCFNGAVPGVCDHAPETLDGIVSILDFGVFREQFLAGVPGPGQSAACDGL